MNIICVDPRTAPEWQDLVQKYPSSVFNSPEWLKVVAETYGIDLFAQVAVDEDGHPQAGVSFCRVRDLFGERIVTRPFSDYCDPLVHDQQEWERLVEPLLSEHCMVTARCLHNDVPLSDERFKLTGQAKWHGIDLRPDLNTLWERIDGSARRAIKKAQNEGVTVRAAQNEDDLRAFFKMHLGIRKGKYHLVAQPYRFFEMIWKHFIEQGKGVVLLAVYQNEIVGGIFFLEWKDTFYYKFNASMANHLTCRPNDLLTWTGIQYAKEKGYPNWDFGLSDWDQEGLLRYKRKYASVEKTISFLQHVPDDAAPVPHSKQLRKLMSQLTDLFTDGTVPDPITEKAGEILYPLFI